MALTPDRIDDFVTATLRNFRRHQWTDLALEYPEYVCTRLMKMHKKSEQGGEQIDWKIKVRNTDSVRQTGMYAEDQTNVVDHLITAQIPWRMQTGNFVYSIYEKEFQSDDYMTIVKLLKVREHALMSEFVEHNEVQLWSAPVDQNDVLDMHGIPYWIVQNPLDGNGDPQVGDYIGGNPASAPSGAAGVNSNTYPRWRNWAFGYRQVTEDDFVRKFKRAIRYTRFRPPVKHPSTDMGQNKYEAFTTYNVVEELETLAEKRNDNLGNDVARYMDQVAVGGVPIEHVFYLTDTDTTDPVYGMNWSQFRPFAKKGCYMRRFPPQRSPRQHGVREVHIDSWMNFFAINRRSLFGGQRVA